MLTLYLLQLILPIAFIILLIVIKPKNKFELIARSITAVLYTYYILITGQWHYMLSYYLMIPVCSLTAVALWSLWMNRRLKIWTEWNIGSIMAFFFFIMLLLITIPFISLPVNPSSIYHINFPLKNGLYSVTQGGNHPQINHHYLTAQMMGAPNAKKGIDLVKLNAWGSDVNSLHTFPKQLNQYEIYGDSVYSPIAGKVYRVQNNKADHRMDSSHIWFKDNGNYIIIQNQSDYIVLGHLQQGTIVAQKGERLEVGQYLGRVGNSGYSSYPHLHLHGYHRREEKYGRITLIDDSPLQLFYNNSLLTRNDLIWN
ncbi:MAG: M23 family metallopeptidase [Reichenbachiella sp.]